MPIDEAHPTRPINAYGETKLTIERALPHYERAYGIRSICLRYFNAAGADPDGELGEDHHPERHVIPLALRGRGRRPAAPGVRRRLPDAGRHVPARLHPRDRPGAGAPAGARRARGRAAARPSTTWATGGRTRCARCIAAVERVTGGRCRTNWPRGGPATRRCSTRRAPASRPNSGWMPRFEQLDTIIDTAWKWSQAHPHGYQETQRDAIAQRPHRSRAPGCAAYRRPAAVGRDARLQRAGDDRGDHPARSRRSRCASS